MNDEKQTSFVVPFFWALVTIVLFVLGRAVNPVLGFFAMGTIGMVIATGVRAYTSLVLSPPRDPQLQQQVQDLQSRLDEAESEIHRLSTESDFDRKLIGREPDDGGPGAAR